MCKGQLDDREDWVEEEAELRREDETVCTSTDTFVDDKWSQMSV
jgi:hypothetical protein